MRNKKPKSNYGLSIIMAKRKDIEIEIEIIIFDLCQKELEEQ